MATEQWQYLLKNLGQWHGSFATFSADGRLLQDIPSTTILEGINDNQSIRQIVRRCPPAQPVEELLLEYNTLSKGLLFFPNGAFSFGTIQLAPFTVLGAELGLIAGDRRVRVVHVYDNSAHLEKITLIREQLGQSPAMTDQVDWLEHLWGTWHGTAQTVYPDIGKSSQTYPTQLTLSPIGEQRLQQELKFAGRTIASQGQITGQRIQFGDVQVLLLPDGVSCSGPLRVKFRQPLFWEAGWLISPGHRQRLIRSYDSQGEWESLTLVDEFKSGAAPS
jgi:hypothetical protein